MSLPRSLREKGVIALLLTLISMLVILHIIRSVVTYTHPVETFPRWIGHPVQKDLNAIKKSGKLVALTRYSANSYFLYRGETMGFEYELLKLFAKDLGVTLEIKTPSTEDSLFIMLNSGEGDLIAADMTITRERAERVLFSDYHNTTRMVVVQKKNRTGGIVVKSAIDLLEKKISIRKGSNYHLRIENLKQEVGGEILIDTIPNEYETEDLIRMVNDGEIAYTIANENIARVNAELYPDLDMNVIISSPQRIAWGFRTSSPKLVESANSWMRELRALKPSPYSAIYKRYYGTKAISQKVQESEFYSLLTGAITPYDSIFKESGTPLFPWTLLAALAYQESHFDPSIKSWSGAEGLMQLLPSTLHKMGESNGMDPRQSVRAAAKYLALMRNSYWKDLPDNEAVNFSLASYNSGVAHVLDARRLAKELHLNPNKWNNNVEKALLKLNDKEYYYNPVVKYGYCRCDETYKFVRQVSARAATYSRFIREAEEIHLRDSLRISNKKLMGITVAEAKNQWYYSFD